MAVVGGWSYLNGSHAPNSPQPHQGVLPDMASQSSLAALTPAVSTAVRYSLIPSGIS